MPLHRTAALLLGCLLPLTGCSGSDDPSPDAAPTAAASADVSAFTQALEAQEAGDLDRARQLLEEVVGNEPDNLLAHYNLGLVHQTQGDVTAALSSYERARSIDPDYVPALFNSATIYAQNDPALAMETYRRIIVLQPEAPTAYLNLGLLEIAAGQVEEGTANLETALRQDPSLANRLDEDQMAAVEQRVQGATPTPSG